MEIKKVQLVQMQAKLSGFFFALRSRKCYRRFDVLHSIGEIVLSCAMFFLGRDAWY
jgi:hypothetical protein